MNAFATLPSAIATEQAVLSCMLQSPKTLARAARELSEDVFHHPANKLLWRTIIELGDACTAINLQQKLGDRHQIDDAGGPAAVLDLFTLVPTPAHYDFYADPIRETFERRETALAGQRIIDAANDPDADYRQEAATALSEIAARRQGADAPKDLKAMLFDFFDDFEARMEGRHRYGIRTRFKLLNGFTGGLPDGNLIVVGGARGSGKSILAQNFAEDCMEEGKRVIWFSFEMNRREIMNRLIASAGDIPGRVLFDPENNRPTQAHMNSMTRVTKSMLDADLLRLRDQHLTVDEIRLETLDEIRQGNVGAVIVDYLQLVPATDARAPREQQVAGISRKLRALALETELPVIALSQLNKEGDSRESMAIEQDASVILKLVYQDDAAQKAGHAFLKIDKNRNGKSHVAVQMKREGEFFHFIEHNHTE